MQTQLTLKACMIQLSNGLKTSWSAGILHSENLRLGNAVPCILWYRIGEFGRQIKNAAKNWFIVGFG
jgi:hypothetical protein